jgi:hypothetical protein
MEHSEKTNSPISFKSKIVIAYPMVLWKEDIRPIL